MSAQDGAIHNDLEQLLGRLSSSVDARGAVFAFYEPSSGEYLLESNQIIGCLSDGLQELVDRFQGEGESDHPFRTLENDSTISHARWTPDNGETVHCVPLRLNTNYIGVVSVDLANASDQPSGDPERVRDFMGEHAFSFARSWMFHSGENHFEHPFLVGDTDEWQKVKDHLMAAAGFDQNEYPVYIHGEPGTGKEFAAHFVHSLSGRSRRGKLVSVNCPTIQDELAGTELFGHVRGAFTGAHEDREGAFERANNGTLFLDEVADLSPSNQKRLLRAVEYGKVKRLGGDEEFDVDVRVICATKKELEREVERGNFREDLYARLRTLKIEMPPLRRWKEKLPELVDMFSRHQAEIGGSSSTFTQEAKEALKRHDYPANCRELKNIVCEMSVRFPSDTIQAEQVEKFFSGYTSPVRAGEEDTESALAKSSEEQHILDWTLEPQSARKALEKYRLETALRAPNGNVRELADTWDVTRTAGYKWCGKHEMEPRDFRS